MKDDNEGGGKKYQKCHMDGIGESEEKERENSIRKTDTDLYIKMNLQTRLLYRSYCTVCAVLLVATVALQRGEEIRYSKEKITVNGSRVKADTHNTKPHFQTCTSVC